MRRLGAGPTGFWATILNADFRKHDRRRPVSDIAKSTGISERTLYHYMKGPNWPPLDLAYCLCKYVGITLEEAVGEFECPGPRRED